MSDEMPEGAKRLLRILCDIEQWVKWGDPRAKVYLDAGAVKVLPDGRVAFHRHKLADLLGSEQLSLL